MFANLQTVKYFNERRIFRFSACKDFSGESLSQQILSTLSMWGLEPSSMRGQGYNAASNMSGKFQGVQARISAIYPQAVYMHCACHVLNLALNNACAVLNIVQTLSATNDIINFFRAGLK